MSRRTTPLAPVEGDLTSMIDVVFLMIVFFLCTLSFKVLEGRIDSRMPKDAGPSRAAVASMFDALDLELVRDASRAGGLAVRVQRARLVDVAALPALVAAFVASTEEPRARVAPGPGVTYGEVVGVLDACLAGGLLDLTFAAGSR